MSSLISPYDFNLEKDNLDANYSACGVFYVSLSTFRDVFKFSTSKVKHKNDCGLEYYIDKETINNSEDINYIFDIKKYPSINPIHAMMNHTLSRGRTYNYEIDKQLIKHDYIYHLCKKYHKSVYYSRFLPNLVKLKNEIEEFGWKYKVEFEKKFLDNKVGSEYVKHILLQIAEKNRFRLIDDKKDSSIYNTDNLQSVPFINGDTISFLFQFKRPVTKGFDVKIYKIILVLTDDTANNLNTNPLDSAHYQTSYNGDIKDVGVPGISTKGSKD